MVKPPSPRRIDVHHHIIPPAFVRRMEELNIREVAGAPLPHWSPRQSLDVMDVNDIELALVSLSAPGVNFGDQLKAITLARECNEFAAGMVQEFPGRFGFFAVLPMPFTDAACREAVHAFDRLGADGVVLLGSTDGYFLGDPRFDDLMELLDRRHAVVFVHPNMHATSQTLKLAIPGFFVEFLCDTTRAASNLILSGKLEQFPHIRWVLAHAGGFLPYIAWRLSLSNLMPQFADRAPQGFLTYVRRLYFDTALSPSPYALAALLQLAEPSHILFGSDFPFAPPPVTALQTQQLAEIPFLDDAARRGINRDHALALFPRHAHAQERPDPAPKYGPANLRTRLRQIAIKPIVRLADHVRNR